MDEFKVYRHRRLDTFEVFYVGIGKGTRYKSKRYRNTHWHNVVNKYNYSIEIIQENLSWGDACELEILLISEYGRQDLKTGCLVNMTGGGEGAFNISEQARNNKRIILKNRNNNFKGKNNPFFGKHHTEESIKLMRESKLGNKNFNFCKPKSEEYKRNLSLIRKGKYAGFDNKKSKLVLNTETGIFYGSTTEAANAHTIIRSTLKSQLLRGTKNKTSLIFC